MSSDTNSPVEYCCDSLRPMESLCTEQRPASSCRVWAGEYVDFGLQSLRGCVARHWLGGTIGLLLKCPLTVSDQFQVYNEHSNFLFNLMSSSNSSKYGLPIDNAVPTGTSVAVSSWYF